MKLKKLLPLVLVFALLAVLGWILFGPEGESYVEEKPQGPPPPTEVDVIVVRPSRLDKRVEVNGTVLANEYAELRAEVPGRLVMLDVREGKEVGAGTVIAKLYDADLQAELKRHQAQLTLAKTTEQRLKQLLEVDGVNRQEYDQAVAGMASVQADIAFVEAQLRKTVVTAPFSGVMGLRNVSPGAYVTPADVIATIQQTGALKVDFNVPENQASLVERGDTVEVVVEGLKDTLTAVITATEPQLSTTTRNLRVRALLQNPKGATPGTFAKVYLDAGSSNNAILVPTNSIVPDTRYKRVYTVNGGKAALKTVETGARQENTVEVLSGLELGDSVVVTGILYLRPDAPVRVRSVKTEVQ